MHEKNRPLQLDTVFANVSDLDAVLCELYTKLQLRPFLRFEFDSSEGVIPIALIRLGKHTLELVGRTAGERPESGIIHSVEIEAPVENDVKIEPEPGMKLVCHPGSTFRIRSLKMLTSLPQEETTAFIESTGATMQDPGSPLELNGVHLHFVAKEGLPSEKAPGFFFPGWHRLSVRVSSVTDTYEMMAARDSHLRSFIRPFQVMPGLREAMLLSSSGLMVQITEGSLLNMTPALTLEWVRSKFSEYAIRFKKAYHIYSQ